MGDAHPVEMADTPKLPEGHVPYDRAAEGKAYPHPLGPPFEHDLTPKEHDLKGFIIVKCGDCGSDAQDKPGVLSQLGWKLWGGSWHCGKCWLASHPLPKSEENKDE